MKQPIGDMIGLNNAWMFLRLSQTSVVGQIYLLGLT